ncbi:MAG: hypothetical protein ACI8RZ_005598 [Myxococcota bacterium]|jgi:hypothetical protein
MLFLLLACAEAPIDSDVPADSVDPAADCLTLSPLSLDFASLAVLDGESASEVVTLTNTCAVAVSLYSVALEGDTDVFSTVPVSGGDLGAGVALTFTIQYVPEASGEHAAQLVVESELGTLSTDLTGEGVAPDIAVTPAELSFGEIDAGCSPQQTVTIKNAGDETLIISGLDFSSETSTFSLNLNEAENGPLPWSLALSDEVAVEVAFTPSNLGFDSASLVITSNDPSTREVTVLSEGQGGTFEQQIDVLIQPDAEADILFAVDKSCSMDDKSDELIEHFGAFTDAMDAGELDYRVALIVQDSGLVYGADPYIDQSNAWRASEITYDMRSGSEGSYTESGFTLLLAAVAANSWIRDSAELHLIGFSDEPEQSRDSDYSDYNDYISEFQMFKDDPDDVVFHAIGGDYPGGCDSAEPYTGFYEATVATGGIFESICTTDWDATLESVGSYILPAPAASFSLSQPAVSETIAVLVDAQSVSSWQHDTDNDAIVFDADHIPVGGAEVTISYIRSHCP